VPHDSRKATTITLAGMRFHVRVGVLPHERELAQPLELDLTVRLTAGADVLDYRTLYAIVREVVEAEPLDYLEVVAAAIASRVLALPSAAYARVAVRKPHVALGAPLAYAEVVVEQGT
jgi:7,8-dihydroneopterin aldolase/epimerase/oxygenase